MEWVSLQDLLRRQMTHQPRGRCGDPSAHQQGRGLLGCVVASTHYPKGLGTEIGATAPEAVR